MNIFDCFPSKYLKCTDLNNQEVELIIRGVTLEQLPDGTTKPICYFQESQRGLLLNRVNSKTLADAYSPETDRWIGRPVVLVPSRCEYKGESVDCIRMRIPQIVPAASIEVQQPQADPFTPEIFTPTGNGRDRESVIQI